MKRQNHLSLLLFIVLIFNIVHDSYGQHRIVEVPFSDKITNVIVREYDFPSTVSYIETADSHFFAYAKDSMQLTCAILNKQMFVRDFVIHDNRVYFCGYMNGASTRGLWGWFNMADFGGGFLNIKYYQEFNCAPQYVDTLHQIAIHVEKEELHMAMVGSCYDGIAKRRWCLIDLWGHAGGTYGWQYVMGIPFGSETSIYDRLSHVCVTDSFIVAAGNFYNPAHSETYRIHRRDNVFFGGHEDTIYIFPLHNTGFIHDSVNFVMTPVYDNLVAVANKAYNNEFGNPQNSILVNVYDMTQTLSIPGASPVYTYNISVSNHMYYSLCSIKYSKNKQVLHLLMSGDSLPFPQPIGSLVAEFNCPPTASPNITYTFLDKRILLSLDNYHNQGNTLACGFDWNNASLLNYFTQPLQAPSICGAYSNLFYHETGYSAKQEYSPYTTCQQSFDCHARNFPIIKKGISTICK